jgi:hypothetical protein
MRDMGGRPGQFEAITTRLPDLQDIASFMPRSAEIHLVDGLPDATPWRRGGFLRSYRMQG